MRRLLHVSASPRGAASFSRTVGEELAGAVAAATPGWTVTRRDLSHTPLPHPGPDFARANALAPDMRGPAERAALARSEALIAEIEAADVLVISTPMHNFTVPSALKAWIDHVVRPGRTFRSTPAGKQGLLADRPAFAIVSCGGRLGEQPVGQADFLTPYLRYVLATIGLSCLDVLCLEEMNRGPEKVAAARAAARKWQAGCIARAAAALGPGA
ncbi:NAD(P)H-dependent oxidoreductase [Xanthobacter sp. 126]|uniref:FMN-dependent NADH-azoreductase n=1 Tax=Xanthobacter sp. 126 TaxID=1131814 RepID=UPI00045EAC44|nr:NAD(P)H-dependent oxidoreductase [Xanthobacter sp. 126]